MGTDSRVNWTPFNRLQFGVMACVVVAGAAVGITASYFTRPSNPELSNALAGGAVALFFGTILGGVGTVLIAELDRLRVRRAAQIEYVMNILADLKAVYDQVDRGRSLVVAHQSAKTYGDEMKNFIAARVKLRQVERAVIFDDRGVAADAVRGDVRKMAAYLGRLVGEFEREYKKISREQSAYEARMKAALEKDLAPPANSPWDLIAGLEHVRDLIQHDEADHDAAEYRSSYGEYFLKPLDDASRVLRAVLSREYGNRAPAPPRDAGRAGGRIGVDVRSSAGDAAPALASPVSR